MAPVEKNHWHARHDAVRQRAADVLRDVAQLNGEGPRVSLEILSEFPTTEYWLRAENGIELSAGNENPLITGELNDGDMELSLDAAEANSKTGSAVLEHIDLVNLVEAKKAFALATAARGGTSGDRQPMNANSAAKLNASGPDPHDAAVGDALSLGEFIDAFANVCKAPRHELAYLFMKIDHNSDGFVAWDEFLSYVVLNDKGHEASRIMEGAQRKFEPQPKQGGSSEDHKHRERINRIIYVPGKNHYVTTSRDGSVRVWDATALDPVHVANNGNSWINDAVHLSDVGTNKLAVAAADRTITFYEMSAADSKKKYALHGRMALLDLPLCLAYWVHNVKGAQTPVLACGDDTGSVTVYSARDLVNTVARWGEGKKPMDPSHSKKACLYRLKLHSDWVTALTHVSHLHALLSAGLDATIKLTDLMRQLDASEDRVLNEDEITTLHTLRGHSKGVFSLVTMSNGGRQLCVSASLDRRVVVWNLETGDEVTTLEGHRTYVQQIVANETAEQVITLGADCELRVWELTTFTCTQTVQALGSDVLSECNAILFNEVHNCLVTGARDLTLWQLRQFFAPIDVIKATSFAPSGHKMPLVAVRYCRLYHLVISADESSVICVWDVHTGRQLFRFEHADARLTCMKFDHSGRRLVTGADDGAVRLFNFSSGELLRKYTVPTGERIGDVRTEEVTDVLHIAEAGQQLMCAVGWSREVWLWPDPEGDERTAPGAMAEPRILKGHDDDIHCIAFVPPTWLATGSYDGEILLWDLLHNEMKRRLVVPDLAARVPSPVRHAVPHRKSHTPLRSSDLDLALSHSIEHILVLDAVAGGLEPENGAALGGRVAPGRGPPPTLVSTRSDGALAVWHVMTGRLLLEVHNACEPGEALTAVAYEDTGCFLITGDSAGFVRLWDIAALSEHALNPANSDTSAPSPPEGSARVLLSWRAHSRSVIAADYLSGISGFLTAGSDCTVRLWSLAGEQIGVFGQKAEWSLDTRSTWLDAEPCEVGTLHMDKDMAQQAVNVYKILPPPVIASLMSRAGRRRASFQGPQVPKRLNHREMRAMHERAKAARPTSSRARQLLDTTSGKACGEGGPPLPHAGKLSLSVDDRAPALHKARQHLAISPEAMRQHGAALYRTVLPPIGTSASAVDAAGSLGSPEPSFLSGEPSVMTIPAAVSSETSRSSDRPHSTGAGVVAAHRSLRAQRATSGRGSLTHMWLPGKSLNTFAYR